MSTDSLHKVLKEFSVDPQLMLAGGQGVGKAGDRGEGTRRKCRDFEIGIYWMVPIPVLEAQWDGSI